MALFKFLKQKLINVLSTGTLETDFVGSIPSCPSALPSDIISLTFSLLLTVKWINSSTYLMVLRLKKEHACEVLRIELVIIIYNLRGKLSQWHST